MYLAGVLLVGAGLVTLEWDALACFDGSEPTCSDQPAEHGLGVIQASSWCLAAVGLLAAVGSFAAALRARRLNHLGFAFGLYATAALTAEALQTRL